MRSATKTFCVLRNYHVRAFSHALGHFSPSQSAATNDCFGSGSGRPAAHRVAPPVSWFWKVTGWELRAGGG